MLVFHDDFLGYSYKHWREEFSSSDNIKDFEKALLTKPDDWYYRTAKILYQRNAHGHRCKDLKNIDLDNYFLVTGCSLTEGIGLELEKTYPYLLSEKFNCDYYNLGLAGTGLDVIMHNLIIWFAKVKKKPKFVVIQVPTMARFTVVSHDQDPLYTQPKNIVCTPYTITSGHNVSLVENFIVSGEMMNFFTSRYAYARIQYNSFIDVPIIEIHSEKPAQDGTNEVEFPFKDEARDSHPGIISNYLLADKISNMLGGLI
jgi:hypothetical protein